MNQQMTITVSNGKSEWTSRVAKTLGKPIEWTRKHWSKQLERELTTAQTLWLMNAQAAGIIALFATGGTWALRLALMAWFGWSVLRCRKVLREHA